jgi:uroporphyrinogen-III synthase
MPHHLVVTRPLAQALPWLQALQLAGYQASSLPLIDIAPVTEMQDQEPKETLIQQTPDLHALMFVSSNAVEYFFQQKQHLAPVKYREFAIKNIANRPWLRYWATGPGTVNAMLAQGVALPQIDAPDALSASFDSEALWRVVQPQLRSGMQVLIVRGRDVGMPDSSRDWLAQRITASAARAHTLVVYERRAPVWQAQQLAQAQVWLRDGSVWLWSSSQALSNLPLSCDVSQAVCICTHPRIAQAAQQRGFAVVLTSRPTVQDVVVSIESLT